ncbi:MAG: aromatic ring-hydroxylating dioxygenase subunit alpha [Pseudomonadota bacterium]
MSRALIDELNRRLLEQFQQRGQATVKAQGRLPASDFTCPERFGLERRALFEQTPQPVAFSAELPEAGSYLALQVVDTPVVLTRAGDGATRAFINSCRHRGARVADGSGNGENLVCPFHGWTYSLDGKLRGRPGNAFFSTPTVDCGLEPLPACEIHGLIVIAVDPGVAQANLHGALQEIGEQLAAFNLQTYRPLARQLFEVEANWKLGNDLSLESYHFATLHRDSVARLLTDNAIVDTYECSSRWAFPLKSIERLAELEPAAWPDQIEGSVTYTLLPGVMLIINAQGAQMIRAEPGRSPGQSRVSYVGIAGAHASMETARQAYEFGGKVFRDEDLPIAESCQQGLTASGNDLLLGRNEPLLHFWHRLWDEAVAALAAQK